MEKQNTEASQYCINVLGGRIEAPNIERFFSDHGAYLDEMDELLEEDDSGGSTFFKLLINDPEFQKIIAYLNSEKAVKEMDDFFEGIYTGALNKYIPRDVVARLEGDEVAEGFSDHSTDCLNELVKIRKRYNSEFKSFNSYMRKVNKALMGLYSATLRASNMRAFCLKHLLSKVTAGFITDDLESRTSLAKFKTNLRHKPVLRGTAEHARTQQWLCACPAAVDPPEEIDPYELIVDKPLKVKFHPVEVDTSEVPGVQKAYIARLESSPMSVKLSILLIPVGQSEYMEFTLSAFDGSFWSRVSSDSDSEFCLEDFALQYGEERRAAYIAMKDALTFEIARAIENNNDILDVEVGSVLDKLDVIEPEVYECIASTAEGIDAELFQEEEFEGGIEGESGEIDFKRMCRGHVRDKFVSIDEVISVARALGIEVNLRRGKGSHVMFFNPATSTPKALGRNGGKIRFAFVDEHFRLLGVRREDFLPYFFKSLKRRMRRRKRSDD